MEPRRLGNAHPNITPYEAFRARDRWFALAAANDRQWATLCDAIDRSELKDDPRFTTNRERVANRPALLQILEGVFATRDADEWLAILREASLPCGPINTVPDVFEHPQAQARNLVQEVAHPTAGPVRVTGFPYKLSQTPAGVRRPPPLLGQHTHEILYDVLGYSSEKVGALREGEAV